jgi:hypothetical protein
VLEVPAPAGGEQALGRVREVLEAVLEHSDGEWPELDRWKALLPAWFVESCVDDAQIRDCVIDRWSLRAWIYWFQPGIRQWRWWSGQASSDGLTVTILVLQRPYLRGALEWLLKVATATAQG